MSQKASNETTSKGVIPERYQGLARWLLRVGVFLVPLGLFLPVVWFDFLLAWDDRPFVFDRPVIEAWGSAPWKTRLLTPEVGYPIPVPTAVCAFLYSVFGEAYPTALHLFMLASHLVNIGLATVVARRVLKVDSESLLPLLVVLPWAIHPAVVESVVWATNIKNQLAALFFFGAIASWAAFLERDEKQGPLLTVALSCIVLGFGCRPDMGMTPLVLVAYTFFRSHASERKRSLLILAPFVVAGLAIGLLAKKMHDDLLQLAVLNPKADEFDLTTILESVGFYVGRLANVVESRPVYPQEWVGGSATTAMGAVALVGVVGLGVWLWKREKRYLLALLAMLAFVYAPFSNITPLPRFVADTYLYTFGLLFFSFVAGLAVYAFQSVNIRRGLLVVWGLFVVSLLSATASYVPRWSSTYELWNPIVAEDPSIGRGYELMMNEAVARGDMERAREILDRSGDVFGLQQQIPWYAAGIYEQTGDLELALAAAALHYQAEAPPKPDLARVTLDILVKYDVPMSHYASVDGFSKWLVETYASRPDFHEGSALGVTSSRVVEYLEQQDPALKDLYEESAAQAIDSK